ncbi:C6 zinc finger domain protein [Fusarium tjaetaba]|uniref:C6 zinc finger domain protein n=1 Tax=Fusarium tjaetaba TaxID=1567544 RepID=A0A8H5R638_9HYPO|nr:C6 zinc finger domain protein [Fusarium tjaetaba]KAF5627225.1 C6 zinc finger domain protein [Fusarium tjaetaba]
MARKRLSWAINTAGRLSAQCQLLAGVYLVYNSEPVAAWKMISGALLSLGEQAASGVPAEETNTKIDNVLDQRIRIAAIMFLSRLRCEIDIPFAPVSFELPIATTLTDQMPLEDGLSHVATQNGTDILCIQGHACAQFQLLRPEASVADLHGFQRSISSMLTALEEWRFRSRLGVDQDSDTSPGQRDSDIESHQGEVQQQMQTLYYETKELILRPSLYLVLHSRHIEEAWATASTEGEEPRSFEKLLTSHVTSQLQAMVSQHRALLLRRIHLCLGNVLNRPSPKLPDVGWLKHQTCLTLALLLVASNRVQHGVGDDHDIDLVVERAVNFLAHDGLRSEESGIAADILRNYQAQRNEPS